MKKLWIIPALLLLIGACEEESAPQPPDNIEEENYLLTEQEAISITKEISEELRNMIIKLGEDNNWSFENPGDYSIAKPSLLSIATEEFADKELAALVKEYYCNCDIVMLPSISDHTIRLQATEIEENSFKVSGINLGNFVIGLHELKIEMVQIDNQWKLNNWDIEFLEATALDLSTDEVQQAFPEYKLLEETTYNGMEIYKLQSDDHVLGIDKNSGALYDL